MVGTPRIRIKALWSNVLAYTRKVSKNFSTNPRTNGCSALTQCDFHLSLDERMLDALRAVQDARKHGRKHGK